MLLNSAEGILKERKGPTSHEGKVISASEKQSALSGANSLQSKLQNRLLKLQGQLDQTQEDLSREQARKVFLNRDPGQINETLKFNEKPLFPELKNGIDASSLRDSVALNVNTLTGALKKIQVEMENLMALNFNNQNSPVINNSELFNQNTLKAIDPGRVARLTRE